MELEECMYMKFGSLRDLQDLQSNGSIYCKHLKYFTEVEDGKVRGDKDENCIEMRYFESGRMNITPKNMKPFSIDVTNVKFKLYETNPVGNIYCLFMFHPLKLTSVKTPLYHEKCKGFGSHFLIVQDSVEFIRRIKDKLNELNLSYTMNRVTYKDLSKYTGKKDFFTKDLEYDYQIEFRILIRTGLDKPFKFTIGDISDISSIQAVKETPYFCHRPDINENYIEIE